uniref:PTBP1-like RNA recognition motif 2 domain-containing protein n=1 Tax=Oryza glumipatula TaxID=40148 RepID=A0A0E0AVE1_9ORYZ
MGTHVEASIKFQSHADAENARKAFHGCCRMDLQFEQTPTTSNNSSSPVSLVMKELKADIEELRIVLKELATIIQEKLANEEEWHSKQEVAEEMHTEMDVAVGMVMPSPITVPPTQPVGLEICVKRCLFYTLQQHPQVLKWCTHISASRGRSTHGRPPPKDGLLPNRPWVAIRSPASFKPAQSMAITLQQQQGSIRQRTLPGDPCRWPWQRRHCQRRGAMLTNWAASCCGDDADVRGSAASFGDDSWCSEWAIRRHRIHGVCEKGIQRLHFFRIAGWMGLTC